MPPLVEVSYCFSKGADDVMAEFSDFQPRLPSRPLQNRLVFGGKNSRSYSATREVPPGMSAGAGDPWELPATILPRTSVPYHCGPRACELSMFALWRLILKELIREHSEAITPAVSNPKNQANPLSLTFQE